MAAYTETIELKGHLIDSLILPKVLDEILNQGGSFEIVELRVGHTRAEPSYAQIEVSASTKEALNGILGRLRDHGADVLNEGDVELEPAPQDGVFPEGFYVTTNLPTFVRYEGEWLALERARMDCGIALDPQTKRARPVRWVHIKKGDLLVVGHRGVRVQPQERSRKDDLFGFMTSEVSAEKPKTAVIQKIAREMVHTKAQGRKLLLVAGQSVVHTGAVPHAVRLINMGFVDMLFAGNALAAHDIEQSLYGTALGIYLDKGLPAKEGHQNHMRAINAVRAAGGIRAAVEKGLLTSGVMHACVKHGIPYVLAGSIRDDGPLPDVEPNVMVAQERMASLVPGVGLALMIGTMLHSIATGNVLPSEAHIVAVDINPAVVTKLLDRGSFQTVGIVSDTEPFLRELVGALERERQR
jgi:lysine-ketoglutarate reductase/saccharopine dehydrogenase-like protein (TIGR00300 family)